MLKQTREDCGRRFTIWTISFMHQFQLKTQWCKIFKAEYSLYCHAWKFFFKQWQISVIGHLQHHSNAFSWGSDKKNKTWPFLSLGYCDFESWWCYSHLWPEVQESKTDRVLSLLLSLLKAISTTFRPRPDSTWLDMNSHLRHWQHYNVTLINHCSRLYVSWSRTCRSWRQNEGRGARCRREKLNPE